MQAGAQDFLVKGEVEKDLLPRSIRYAIERRRAAEAIRRLEQAVQTMQLGVTITDIAGRIVYVNQAEAAMHGYEVEELLGRDARSLSPQKDWNPLPPRDLVQVRRWKRERVRHRKDGTTFPVQLMSDIVTDAAGRPDRASSPPARTSASAGAPRRRCGSARSATRSPCAAPTTASGTGTSPATRSTTRRAGRP